jgi:hypothetical protein
VLVRPGGQPGLGYALAVGRWRELFIGTDQWHRAGFGPPQGTSWTPGGGQGDTQVYELATHDGYRRAAAEQCANRTLHKRRVNKAETTRDAPNVMCWSSTGHSGGKHHPEDDLKPTF